MTEVSGLVVKATYALLILICLILSVPSFPISTPRYNPTTTPPSLMRSVSTINPKSISIDTGSGIAPLKITHSKIGDYRIVHWGDLSLETARKYPADALVAVKEDKLRVITTSPTILKKSSPVDLELSTLKTSPVNNWEPDFVIQSSLAANDPYISSQWAINRLSLPTVWDSVSSGSNIKVAVMDTGVDYNHPDLSSNFLNVGYDFVNGDNDVMDGDGHGTHVAGTIAASINNGIGVAGMANVSFFSEKILDDTGQGFYSDAISGIYDAVDKGANILSNSWGGTAYSSSLENAVNYALNNGALFIAAAGNDASSEPHYPSSYDGVISVSSTTSTDQLSSFSNYGSTIDLAAPGSSILSTYPGNSYATLSGTSMATPHVSGIAALLWSYFPNYTSQQITNLLYQSAEDLGPSGYDIQFGYGLVNPLQALQGLDAYDVTVNLRQMDYQSATGSRTFSVETTNLGAQDVSNLNVTVSLNTSQVQVLNYPLVPSGATVNSTIVIDQGFVHANLTASIPAYLNETRVDDNTDQVSFDYVKILKAQATKEGGLVKMEVEIDHASQVNEVKMVLNGQVLSSYNPQSDFEIIYFPVFDIGINNLELSVSWASETLAGTTTQVIISQISPLLSVDIGDQINWIYNYTDGTAQQQHWTFSNWLSATTVNVTLYVNSLTGATLNWEIELWAVVDVTNGYYVQTNFGWDGHHFSWLTNLDSYNASDQYAGFYNWNSVAEVHSSVNSEGYVNVLSQLTSGAALTSMYPTGIPQYLDDNSTTIGTLESTSLLPRLRGLNLDLNSFYSVPVGGEVQILATLSNTGDIVEAISAINITLGNEVLSYVLKLDNTTLDVPYDLFPATTITLEFKLYNVTLGTTDLDVNITSFHPGGQLAKTFNASIEGFDHVAPTIIASNNSVSIEQGSPSSIFWTIVGDDIASYQLYLDGSTLASEMVDNRVTFDLSTLAAGDYNISLEVIDIAGNSALSSVHVTVNSVSESSSSKSETSSLISSTSTTRTTSSSSETTSAQSLLDFPVIMILGNTLMIIVVLAKRKSNTG